MSRGTDLILLSSRYLRRCQSKHPAWVLDKTDGTNGGCRDFCWPRKGNKSVSTG